MVLRLLRVRDCSSVFALLLFGCAGAPDDEPLCGVSSALIGGVPQTSYLAHGAEVHAAVGVIVSGATEAACVGTLVASRWLLSAAHCADFPEPFFALPGASPVPILRVETHPTRDVALFELGSDACGTPAGTHLPLARFSDEPGLSVARLSRATLGGLGGGSGSQGSVAFLVETVAEIDERYVVVDGRGRTGACLGDSGGPLLVRDETGSVAVLGALSMGEPSCRGLDYYERLDGLVDWVDQLTGEPSLPRQDCGAIDEAGRCFDDLAVWCDGEELRAQRCGSAGCGFSDGDGGYRCAEELACTGDGAGHCSAENTASVCGREGADVRSCANGCGYDPQSGVARCD